MLKLYVVVCIADSVSLASYFVLLPRIKYKRQVHKINRQTPNIY
jgi:hypothetical protein